MVAKTNASGSLTYQAQYAAFGNQTASSGSTLDRQKNNSKDTDPTNLVDEGFRYRDLETGMFISRDPAGFVDGPNLYTYVVQNPWTKFDPEGLDASNATPTPPPPPPQQNSKTQASPTSKQAAQPSPSAKSTSDDNKQKTDSTTPGPWQKNIHGTVFGGSSEKPSDHETSAYTGKPITDSTPGASLPDGGLNGKYIEIKNDDNGKTDTTPIIDKGPHYNGTKKNPGDPYWETNSRPRAETEPKTDKNGKPVLDKQGNPVLKYPNPSGLDLTPEEFNKLRVPWKPGYTDSKGHEHEGSGSGTFDWRFVPPPKQ